VGDHVHDFFAPGVVRQQAIGQSGAFHSMRLL
jgi:hypothetical protein